MQNLEIYLNILLLAIYIIVTYYKYYINIVQLFQVHVLMGTKNLPTNKKKTIFLSFKCYDFAFSDNWVLIDVISSGVWEQSVSSVRQMQNDGMGSSDGSSSPFYL